ncbi:MAG TPA: hypothetical protein VFM82_03565 [Flavobacteriaceae bacterium]|nr:hypothetical protein [Flavobacteriaceae bacterium]
MQDFQLVKKFGNRQKELFGKQPRDLIYLTYGFVKIDLPELINDGEFETLIFECFEKKINRKKINALKPTEAWQFILWVYDELQNISKMEKQYLSSTPEPDLINAGIETLNELGETNLIDTLANGDVLKWEEIKKMPYHVIFDKQRKMKLEADIQKNLARIQRDKAKAKKH